MKNKLDITVQDVMYWKREMTINPISKRKIKENGNLYKIFEKKYNKFFPEGFDIFDSIDERDPITLNYFYKYDSSNNKILDYREINNLILYKENDSIVRCFEKESLEYMKSYKIKNHPVSQVKIPDYIFENIKCKETNQELTLDEKALQVFQLFTNLSIFIDYKKFLSLNKKKLLTFNYETRDFYYQNFSESDRKIIDEKDGKQYFSLQNNELEKKSDDNIKLYLLNQIEQVLSCKDNNLKFMINYILLGGLSIVIEEVKEYYNNFNFSF
jgi:hypothetical protein